MPIINDLGASIRQHLAKLTALAKAKPAEAEVADDTDLLVGVGKQVLLDEVGVIAAPHLGRKDNPHSVTAAQVGTMLRADVDAAVGLKVPLGVLSVSQFGDVGNGNLGLTFSGFNVTFSQAIQAYMLGMYKLMPVQTIALSSVTANPANKTFYLYLRVLAGQLTYQITLTKEVETYDTMYLGAIVTNASGVASNTVGRVSRLGRYRISSSPVGSAIPATVGDSSQPAKLNPNWITDLKINGVDGLVASVTDWTNDANRGWYRNLYTFPQGIEATRLSNILPKIRKITAEFTSYHNVPNGAMHRNSLNVQLDNGTVLLLGTSDAWDATSTGHCILDDNNQDSSSSKAVATNLVNQRLTLTIPAGRTVAKIMVNSAGLTDGQTNYPFGVRGMRNFEFTLG